MRVGKLKQRNIHNGVVVLWFCMTPSRRGLDSQGVQNCFGALPEPVKRRQQLFIATVQLLIAFQRCVVHWIDETGPVFNVCLA